MGDNLVDYSLVIIRGAAFDKEANDSFAAAHSLGSSRGALGYIGGGNDDWYQFSVAINNVLILATSTPGGGPNEFANTLNPLIELYDPNNQLLVSDDNSAADGRNALLTRTASVSGTYRVRVRGVASSGEYFLSLIQAPAVTLSLSGSPLGEVGGIATVTATLSAASDLPVTVNLLFAGTSTLTNDYTRSSTAITIPAGNRTGTVTLTAVQDRLVENNETILVDIDTVTNGLELGTQQVMSTIADDDTATVSIASGTTAVTEGAVGVNLQVMLNVTTNGMAGGVATLASTVTANLPGTGDYSTTAASFSAVATDDQTADITVAAVNDTMIEGIETFSGQVLSATGQATASGARTIAVADNDTATVSIVVDTTTSAEGGAGRWPRP